MYPALSDFRKHAEAIHPPRSDMSDQGKLFRTTAEQRAQPRHWWASLLGGAGKEGMRTIGTSQLSTRKIFRSLGLCV